MQRTWWPEAGTIIVTGPYWDLCAHMTKNSWHQDVVDPHLYNCAWFMCILTWLEWVIKFNSLSRTSDIEVHVIHINCVIMMNHYLPSHRQHIIYKSHLTFFLKKGMKKKYKKNYSIKSYWEKRRDDALMLATIHDDTWNMLNMQHIIPNRWDYSDIPAGGT